MGIRDRDASSALASLPTKKKKLIHLIPVHKWHFNLSQQQIMDYISIFAHLLALKILFWFCIWNKTFSLRFIKKCLSAPSAIWPFCCSRLLEGLLEGRHQLLVDPKVPDALRAVIKSLLPLLEVKSFTWGSDNLTTHQSPKALPSQIPLPIFHFLPLL